MKMKEPKKDSFGIAIEIMKLGIEEYTKREILTTKDSELYLEQMDAIGYVKDQIKTTDKLRQWVNYEWEKAMKRKAKEQK